MSLTNRITLTIGKAMIFATSNMKTIILGNHWLQLQPPRMVSSFPSDYLSLACLGVMHRLLICWLKGPLNSTLPAKSVTDVRKARQFDTIHSTRVCNKAKTSGRILRWKATETEFYQIMQNMGKVIFKIISSDGLFDNYIFVGTTMLSGTKLAAEY
jgi:hypothetical protein